jgi:hypothetical protein
MHSPQRRPNRNENDERSCVAALKAYPTLQQQPQTLKTSRGQVDQLHRIVTMLALHP